MLNAISMGEKETDLFFALCRTPLASPLHPHAELTVDLINKPLASSELPALQGLSNERDQQQLTDANIGVDAQFVFRRARFIRI